MPTSTRIGRAIKIVLINLLVVVLLLFLLEGLTGYALIGWALASYERPTLFESWSEYDGEIGWLNRRSIHLVDRYGPGADLTTNSQRFRAASDVPAEIPSGKTRIVCSGDSFTFGVGVGDQYPWCRRLSELDPRLETVNLGHGGWGIDQSYLWYRRNESTIDHDIHIFAFIFDDFRRVDLDDFRGYGKPYLEVENGGLVQTANPVSRGGYYRPRLVAAQPAFAALNTIDFLGRVIQRVAPPPPPNEERTRAVSSRIFAELERVNEPDGRALVLVFLPIFEDFLTDPRSDTEKWRRFVHEDAERNGYPLIDVVEEIRKLPPDSIHALYNLSADGHFSPAGNQLVADIIYQKLLEIPEVASKLR